VSLRSRVERLEAKAPDPPSRGPEPTEEAYRCYRKSWELELSFVAWHLLEGIEPHFTMDEQGDFCTFDGRFAVGKGGLNIRNLMGKETEAQADAVPVDRWQRFLEADEKAAELLERLLLAGEAADAPDEYELPCGPLTGPAAWGGVDDGVTEEFEESLRRLTWALASDEEVLGLLAGLLHRRDRFVADDKGGGV
jgi:hypothetical protein